jgi:hypothetical protein
VTVAPEPEARDNHIRTTPCRNPESKYRKLCFIVERVKQSATKGVQVLQMFALAPFIVWQRYWKKAQ